MTKRKSPSALTNISCACNHHRSMHAMGERSLDACQVQNCDCTAFQTKAAVRQKKAEEASQRALEA